MNHEVEAYPGELRELRKHKRKFPDSIEVFAVFDVAWNDAPPGTVQIRGNDVRVKPYYPLPCNEPGFKTVLQAYIEAAG